MASEFQVTAVVNGFLVAGQIVAAAEDGVPEDGYPEFADRRIHLLALPRTRGVVAGYFVLGGLRVVTGGDGRGILR